MFFDLQLIISISYEKSVSSVNFNTFVVPHLGIVCLVTTCNDLNHLVMIIFYIMAEAEREEIKDETHALEDDEQDEADDNDEEESSDVDMD